MAIRNLNEPELRSWWDGVRQEMLSEHFLEASSLPLSRITVSLGYDDPQVSFELVGGIPAITLRKRDGEGLPAKLVGLVGDDMGCTEKAVRNIFSDSSLRLPPERELSLIASLRGDWATVKEEYESRSLDYHARTMSSSKKSIVDVLLKRLTEDMILDDPMEQAIFYRFTKGIGREDMYRLKYGYLDHLENTYKARFERGEVDRGAVERDLAFARKEADEKFSAWYSLEGRLIWKLANVGECRSGVGPADVDRIADWAMKEPAYFPYVESGVKKWVKDSYRSMGEKTALIPERFRLAKRRDVKVSGTLKV